MACDSKFSDCKIHRESSVHCRWFSSKFRIVFISLIVLGMIPFAGGYSDGASQPVLATPNPPTTGNWIIGPGETYINHTQTIILNGSLMIENGGSLTLDKVTLLMNSPSESHYNITVRNGGSLTIKGNSNVTAMNQDDEWYFAAFPGSSVHLENSTFSYAGYDPGSGTESDIGIFSGLWFNTTHAKVTNCIIQDSWMGLWFFQAVNGTVSNNIIKDCYKGIQIGPRLYSVGHSGSSNITVEGNSILNCSNHVIGVHTSSQCKISANVINESKAYGIVMNNSRSAIISNNSIMDNQIDVRHSIDTMIIDNTLTNTSTTFDGISLSYNSNITVSRNVIANTGGSGIQLYKVRNSLIEKNSITNSAASGINKHDAGIDIHDSLSTTIYSNNITNSSGLGFRIGAGGGSILITNNIVTGTYDTGILFWQNSGSCTLWGNIFTSNTVNAQDDSSNNHWDNGTHGNYWDDHSRFDMNHDGICDKPYDIPGHGQAQDRYPLMLPLGADITPPTIDAPADLEIPEGSRGDQISWSPSDDDPYWYRIIGNGTIIQEKSWDGTPIIFTLDTIVKSPGPHNITIIVYDRAGNSVSDTVIVKVISNEKDKETISGFTIWIFPGLVAWKLATRARTKRNKLKEGLWLNEAISDH